MQLKARFDHFNFNVLNLERSLDFYAKALGLKEVKRKEAEDGSFILAYLGEEYTSFMLELTWIRDRQEPYNLGDLEYHLCMKVEGEYNQWREYHRELGVICYENEEMGLYFISDPDGYWIEILPIDYQL